MRVVKAPGKLPVHEISIFLAGSIEMGKAVDWQTQVTEGLKDIDCVILNPRRDDWDSSWEQKIENLQFREQVEWELSALDRADFIVFYFDPKTMSPISLMELGLHAGFHPYPRVVVCCPEGFWRKGNVDVVCQRYGLKQVETIEELISTLVKRLS